MRAGPAHDFGGEDEMIVIVHREGASDMKASQRNRIGVRVFAVLIGLWTSSLSAQQLMTLKGHDGLIRSVVFSPDGQASRPLPVNWEVATRITQSSVPPE